MSTRAKREKPTGEETDRIVVAQADDDSAWEKPVRVRRTKPTTVTIPAELAARVAFLALLVVASAKSYTVRLPTVASNAYSDPGATFTATPAPTKTSRPPETSTRTA